MRRTLVVGNWKMHGSVASVADLLDALQAGLNVAEQSVCAVCPPAILLAQVGQALAGSSIRWGGQNLHHRPQGAFTGEISAAMLADVDCQFVIVGHSERRALFAETDAVVAEKFIAAQAAGLTPILCIGESLAQREAGEALSWLEGQLAAIVAAAGLASLANAVLAYEPIWAIGTGKTASPAQAQAVHEHLRRWVAVQDAQLAANLQIIYGGSVKAANAVELFSEQDIDGALVGGASLDAVEFAAIGRAALQT